MKLNSLLFFSILIVLSSCNGQNTSQLPDNSAIGDTVVQLGNSIFIIYQAKNNIYWFGSDSTGVYRYDGKTIINYSVKDGLCNDRIRQIQEDGSGNIFFTTLKGISKFDGKNFTTLPILKSKNSSNEWKLEPGDMWFKGQEGESGPYRYDGKTLQLLEFPKHFMADEYYATENHPWSPYEVYHIYKDSKGVMWFGTGRFGICRYDGKSLSWVYEDQLTLVEGGGSFGIRSIIEDKEGKFWFCNTKYRYDISPGHHDSLGYSFVDYKREKGIEVPEALHEDGILYYLSVIKDNKDDLWMATYDSGVLQYDGKNIFRYSVKDPSKDVTLFSVYKDGQGDLWLGSHNAGAYKFNGKTFEKFKP